MLTAKIIDFPTEKQPATISSAWMFNVDQTENWAYLDNVFTPQECAEIISIGESRILEKARVGGNDAVADQIRDSKVVFLQPSDDMQLVFRRVTDAILHLNNSFFKFDLFGFAEGFQFTKYEAPSGFYGAHIDKMYNGMVRKLSLTIQLSAPEDYEGGELALQFGKTPEVTPKEQGKMVVFPSYVLHEVRPVTKGTRYSLVGWVTGTPFR